MARRRIGLIAALTILATLVAAPAAQAAAPAATVLAQMNAERVANGLSPLGMHSDLTDDAVSWSRHMMETGTLYHNPNLAAVTSSWDALGENVGVGPDLDSLHSSFMDSPGHRGNILGDYDYVGIGVVEESPTKLWVTVIFMRSLERASTAAGDEPKPYASQQPEPTVEQSVAAAPEVAAVPQAVPAAKPAPVVAVVHPAGLHPFPI
jgi:hypothetical protein